MFSVDELVRKELAADRFEDDVTTHLLQDAGKAQRRAVIISKGTGVFSGQAIVEAFSRVLGSTANIQLTVAEGEHLVEGTEVLSLKASAKTCLTIERTLLNFLTHLCGVASLTRKYVDAVKPHPTKILATRKFVPGLRDLQLQAVRAGGGHIHRRNLSDGILIKENHQMIVEKAKLIERAAAVRSPLHRVEIEVQSLKELEAVDLEQVDIVMLDNFSTTDLQSAIKQLKGKCQIEVSGGITLEKVPQLAELGVDFISVGRLTHSAPALDLSMDIQYGQ